MKRILSGFIVVLSFSASAFATEAIEGWGNVTFGMSIEETRIAEPSLDGEIQHIREKYQTPHNTNNKKPVIARYWHLYTISSTKPAITFGDNQFYLITRYNDNQSLYDIILERHIIDDPSITEAVCKKWFEQDLQLLTKQYGTFDKKHQNHDFLPKTKITAHTTPNRKTAYFKGIDSPFTGAPEGATTFKARKTLANAKDEISIIALRFPHLNSCEIRIRFFKHLPSNDSIPEIEHMHLLRKKP